MDTHASPSSTHPGTARRAWRAGRGSGRGRGTGSTAAWRACRTSTGPPAAAQRGAGERERVRHAPLAGPAEDPVRARQLGSHNSGCKPKRRPAQRLAPTPAANNLLETTKNTTARHTTRHHSPPPLPLPPLLPPYLLCLVTEQHVPDGRLGRALPHGGARRAAEALPALAPPHGGHVIGADVAQQAEWCTEAARRGAVLRGPAGARQSVADVKSPIPCPLAFPKDKGAGWPAPPAAPSRSRSHAPHPHAADRLLSPLLPFCRHAQAHLPAPIPRDQPPA